MKQNVCANKIKIVSSYKRSDEVLIGKQKFVYTASGSSAIHTHAKNSMQTALIECGISAKRRRTFPGYNFDTAKVRTRRRRWRVLVIAGNT